MATVESEGDHIACLYTLPRRAHIRLAPASRYIVFDGTHVDNLLSWAQQGFNEHKLDPQTSARLATLRHAAPFTQMPFDSALKCAQVMETVPFEAGQTIMTQGDKGDYFYVMQSGRAKVWRTDPLDDTTSCAATLKAGDTFGEEALLQQGCRNATVHMVETGRVARLAARDFNKLVEGHLLDEIGIEEARKRLTDEPGTALLDCRYDMEYEISRIPGAALIPLDQLREEAHKLDKEKSYIVYCRSGQRSKAAAFLLRQMGLQAVSMAGGITAWPYETNGDQEAH